MTVHFGEAVVYLAFTDNELQAVYGSDICAV